MAIRRVAVIFDDQARPDTTGVYCRRALETLVETVHFRPGELEAIPRQGFDLYLNIDDSFRYLLPPALRPCAWWAIDTHLNPDWCVEKARHSDLAFAAQRDGADLLRAAGVESAIWLPLACDPEIHSKHDLPKQFDVAFVGNLFPGPRAELLELIRRTYPSTFAGNAFFEDMARTYSSARTVFNRSIRNDINMRVFEALACGSLLVTNDLADNGQAELFEDGLHLATYREPEELLEKLDFYLRREETRERIAAAGRAEAIEKHTYRHRIERLLGAAEEVLARVIVGGFSENGHRHQAPTEPGDLRSDTGAGSGDPRPATGGFSENGHRHTLPQHDPFYFGYARPGVLELVPVSARVVLEIGCGAGWLGAAMKARQAAKVIGIELDEAAAEVARQRLDQVIVGDIERLDLDFSPGKFDAVICADVLERLR